MERFNGDFEINPAPESGIHPAELGPENLTSFADPRDRSDATGEKEKIAAQSWSVWQQRLRASADQLEALSKTNGAEIYGASDAFTSMQGHLDNLDKMMSGEYNGDGSVSYDFSWGKRATATMEGTFVLPEGRVDRETVGELLSGHLAQRAESLEPFVFIAQSKAGTERWSNSGVHVIGKDTPQSAVDDLFQKYAASKCILARDERGRSYFVALPIELYPSHQSIADELSKQGMFRQLHVVGGGWTIVDNGIHGGSFGKSYQYGPCDWKQVSELLGTWPLHLIKKRQDGMESYMEYVNKQLGDWSVVAQEFEKRKDPALLLRMADMVLDPESGVDSKEQLKRAQEIINNAVFYAGPKSSAGLEAIERVYRGVALSKDKSAEERSLAIQELAGYFPSMSYDTGAWADKAIELYHESVRISRADPVANKKLAKVLTIIATDCWPSTVAEYVKAAWSYSSDPELKDTCLWALDYVAKRIDEQREIPELREGGDRKLKTFQEALYALLYRVVDTPPEEADQPDGKLLALLTRVYSSKTN